MATPYLTPDILINAPTGISWSTIPGRSATFEQQLEEQTNLCNRATAFVDDYCAQPLRATVDVDEVLGPDFYLTVQNTGFSRAVLSRWPVVALVSAQCTRSTAFPPAWTTIPLNQMRIERPPIGIVGSSAPGNAGTGDATVDIAPGYINWYYGRNGYRLQVTYVNGWPHAGLTASAAKNSTTLSVDDVTGWTGAVGTIYHGQFTETFTCTATSPAGPGGAGPGTLTLAAATKYDHNITGDPGRTFLVTSMPGTIQQACIFYCVEQALMRGATATAAPSLGAGMSGMTEHKLGSYIEEAEFLLEPFRRVF